jgi:hypothetical protein
VVEKGMRKEKEARRKEVFQRRGRRGMDINN